MVNLTKFVLGLIQVVVLTSACTADKGEGSSDWPMWRCDASRSAASGNPAPEALNLLWQREFQPRRQAWDDPLNLDLMTYDRVFEPIVMDGRIFVGFNDQDKLIAMDTGSGETLWTFYAEAPIRLPPVGFQGKIYVCSDDGYLYCVDAANGKLVWKFLGAPNAQHALGNRRLTSAWPARGGPVVYDGNVYFAASIWPFMGTFLYALDAETGSVIWVNDSSGSQYIKQPHSAPSFAGVAPQGAIVATEDLLIVPGGRSVPAVFNRHDGSLKYFEINAGGKGTGGSFVTADQTHYYVHTREKGTRAFDLATGLKTAFMPNEPVLANGRLYCAESADEQFYLRAYESLEAGSKKPEKAVWQVEANGTGDLILAGSELVAVGGGQITVIPLEQSKSQANASTPRLTCATSQNVARLIAADNKLFAITTDGEILVYGASQKAGSRTAASATQKMLDVEQSTSEVAQNLLAAGDAEGYAFWFGDAQDPMVTALAQLSAFEQFAVIDSDRKRVAQLRSVLDAANLYGTTTGHVATPTNFQAPSFVGNMVFVANELVNNLDAKALTSMYKAVRPYGGTLHLLGDSSEALIKRIEGMKLEQAEIQVGAHGLIIHRMGALPGSADWTHQYGDIANTIKSNDSRVKLPLGILWFGGSSNMDVLPRHGHGPPEQVIGGRLFIQGMDCLSARDVYTGRVLWKRQFDDLNTFDIYYDATYDNSPLNPKYNQVHIPGANGRGTNYVVTEDRVYMVVGNACKILDPQTGKDVGNIQLPTGKDGMQPEWGYIGVYKDVLIAGLGFANFRSRIEFGADADKKLKSSRAGFGTKSLDRAASRAILGFDRHSGKLLWQVDANHSFWHNGIVAGNDRIYCLDKNPKEVEDALRRRGLPIPESYRIACLDFRTGEQVWEVSTGIFGTWLGYSEQSDLLLQAGAQGSDRLTTEVGQGMSVYMGASGKLKWKKESLKYAGPCILHNELIITNANSYSESAGAFYLQNGQQRMVKHPLTGAIQPWTMTRAYGCNNIIASENLLTFRSGAAGYYDLLSESGTGNLGGFKSGCTSNLVVANGVLNAPDYTRTCSCAYQNQTSLALIHMPGVEVWSVDASAGGTDKPAGLRQLGINFGAPGDRRDSAGQLWLEYPVVAGASAPVAITLNPEAQVFQQHSSRISGEERSWIFASGVEDIRRLEIDLKLSKSDKKQSSADKRIYDIDLFMAAPQNDALQDRVFNVVAGDKLVAEKVTVGPGAMVHLQLEDIAATGKLILQFESLRGEAILSGISIQESDTGALGSTK